MHLYILVSNASTNEIGTTFVSQLALLVKMCQWATWGHTFTNHNSPCGELWHKVVPILVVLELLIY